MHKTPAVTTNIEIVALIAHEMNRNPHLWFTNCSAKGQDRGKRQSSTIPLAQSQTTSTILPLATLSCPPRCPPHCSISALTTQTLNTAPKLTRYATLPPIPTAPYTHIDPTTTTMSTNRFVFGSHAVSNNLAARVSPKSSAVRRIRESVIRTDGPSSSSCQPIPRPAGTSTTIHNANIKAAEHHSMKANRAKSMPSGIPAKHMAQHSNLQRAYMISCTSNNTTSHPDPLVLSQLSTGILTVDMMLYEDGDMSSVCRLLQCRTAQNDLEGIVVSCGELRGAKSSMKRIGWETSDLPRSVLVGGARSPSKTKQRSR